MKHIYIIFSILLFNFSYSLDKSFNDFTIEFDQSEFIAKVKILKVNISKNDSRYLDISIEILDLYKGKKIKSFKLINSFYDYCSLDFTENSVWLLFASFDEKKVLNMEYCYGSVQIDKKRNSVEYPNIEQTFKEKIEKKIKILNFLKKHNIKKINQHNLKISFKNPCESDFNNYNVSHQKFAVYKLKIDKDLSIRNIKAIKVFDNKILSKEMIQCFKKNLKINNSEIKTIKAKTDLYLIYYYNEAEGENKSFISDKIL